MVTYNKTYGIVYHLERWHAVCDGTMTRLNYKKRKFALAKAENFAHACYKDFTRDNGTRVHFTFVCIEYRSVSNWLPVV